MKNFKSVIPSFFVIGVKDFIYSADLDRFLKVHPVSGIALFNSPHDSPDNIWKDPEVAIEAAYEFITKVKSKINFIAVDQEGGRVRRLRKPFVELPAAQKFGEALENGADLSIIENIYSLSAKQMALSGIQFNLAPVCDLRIAESSSVIGDRAFSTKTATIEKLAKLFCQTFEKETIRTTLKHFPGHGPSKIDSHEKIALLLKNKAEMKKLDTKIFSTLAPVASAILTAHIAFEDKPDEIFSLSPNLLNEFKALIPGDKIWITDDLQTMKAVSDKQPWLSAFDCLYDFILVCGTLDQSSKSIEETIRYAEKVTNDYTKEEALEKRAKRSRAFIPQIPNLDDFKSWKQNILNLYEESLEQFSKIGL